MNSIVTRLKNEFALQLWLHKRRKWSRPEFGPVDVPKLRGKSVLILEQPGEYDLQDRFRSWLNDNGAKTMVISSIEEIEGSSSNADLLGVTYDWLLLSSKHYLVNLFRLRTAIKRTALPVICYAPDTIFYTLNLGYGMAVTQNGGCILMLQNTAEEAHRYGLPRVTHPTFWTWPKHHFQLWSAAPLAYEQRAPVAVLAGTGEPRRIAIMHELSGVLGRSGWTVEWSDGSRTLENHISLVQSAQLIATTSLTQEPFLMSRLSRWESRTSVTGRVWEGFAARTCVITNQASALDQLGFIPGEHYLDLDRVLLEDNYFQNLSPVDLSAIAYHGHTHFHHLLDYQPD